MANVNKRVYLSAPQVNEDDIAAVERAMRSGWIAPAGPDLAAFEAEIADYLGIPHAVGLSSGTAALHLSLKYLGVSVGDAIIVPTVTFGATAFPATYLGAEPVFVDVDASWNLDAELLADAIRALRTEGRRIAAVVPVDLYGTPANYGEIEPLVAADGIPLLEDAAESLGARSGETRTGTYGHVAVLSFNGNKIITTSGGGMVVTDDSELADKVRYWSTQAREPYPWYEHVEIGYNYRLSNILAALGRSQLSRIDEEVARRRQVREWYRARLETIDGVTIQHDPPWGMSNAWLSVARFDRSNFAGAATRIRELLDANNIESRPVWKPMHQQPVYARNRTFLSGAADALFVEGLCLPSGSVMDEEQVNRVSQIVANGLRM